VAAAMARNIANKLAVSFDMLFRSKAVPGDPSPIGEVLPVLGVFTAGGMGKREPLELPAAVGVASTSEDSSEPTVSTVILGNTVYPVGFPVMYKLVA
jgi:hypothetical protein